MDLLANNWPWLLIAFLVSLGALLGVFVIAVGYLPYGAPWPIEAALVLFSGASITFAGALLLIVARAFLLWLIR